MSCPLAYERDDGLTYYCPTCAEDGRRHLGLTPIYREAHLPPTCSECGDELYDVVWPDMAAPCALCEGKGYEGQGVVCRDCDGSGHVEGCPCESCKHAGDGP